jgi:sortase A
MTSPFHHIGRRRVVRWLALSLLAAGTILLSYCLAVYSLGRVFQAHEARKLSQQLRPKTGAGEPSPTRKAHPALPGKGAVLGQIDVPRLHLSVIVVEGTERDELQRAAGHIPGTALPGQPGNIGIAAHRDTFFHPLRAIQRDDDVVLKTPDGTYPYRVVSTSVVMPDDIQVLYPTSRDSLTLVTCYPFNYIGSAPKRFVVRAEMSHQ